MLSVHLTLLLAFTAIVSAVPLEKRWGGFLGSWANHNGRPSSSYLEFGKRFPGANSNAPSCDLSQAVMPIATTALLPPAPGLSLFHVAIGRGTQNYTCDTTNSTAVPVAVGAKATLFNATCIAASSPQLLAQLPDIALQLPIPTTSSSDAGNPAYADMSGHHYFLNPTTPFFNMDTALHSYGAGSFKKTGAAAAPASAIPGPNDQGDGAVTWLKLDARDAEGQVFQEVYRLNTAGGQPPKMCTGMPAAFEVQYAAEYWLWAA
ncbi:hypothetical protein LTR62_004905 [Meristemomyces frigidus]|uniref:Malate dehydrogenase n=1 Tax=Meristemomyces frigidus TaxID=1508187 RepID=A0AAN7TDB7_9PEZI|nr:hypothetical protein LTR62_004905 [Meristemomyces frigidus]